MSVLSNFTAVIFCQPESYRNFTNCPALNLTSKGIVMLEYTIPAAHFVCRVVQMWMFLDFNTNCKTTVCGNVQCNIADEVCTWSAQSSTIQ